MKAKNATIYILVAVILLTSCSSLQSKQKVTSIVRNNYNLLKKVPNEIIADKLNTQSYSISTTDKEPIENQLSPSNMENSNYTDIRGLYLQIVNRDYSNTFSSLKDDVFAKVLNINGISSIDGNTSNPRFFIFFDCGGSGFGSAMTYYGFYYTEDNLPIGWQGEEVDLKQRGNSWIWQEDNTDNVYSTERIIDHWFYFEMHW